MTLADRQSASRRQGDEFERCVATWLKVKGHRIVAQHWTQPLASIEIDFVTEHPDLGEIWVECKGSWESKTGNGLQRTDTLKKAIANAAILQRLPDRRPYWLICSHLPRASSRGDIWLATVRDLFDEVIEL